MYIWYIYQGIVMQRSRETSCIMHSDIRLSSLETLQLWSKVLHGHSHPIHGEPANCSRKCALLSSTWETQVQVLIYLVLGPLMNDDVVNIDEDEKIHYEDSSNGKNRTWEQIGFSTLHTCHESHVIIFTSGMFLPIVSFWYI